jgi:hypothetical protein
MLLTDAPCNSYNSHARILSLQDNAKGKTFQQSNKYPEKEGKNLETNK